MKAITLKASENCPDSEVSVPFIQGMVDRMAISYHKYGLVADAKGKIDVVESLKVRLHKYLDTGNTEYLMDVANFAMIEFMHKGPKKYKATDSGGSPGRAWLPSEFGDDAEVSQRANDGSPQ